MSSLSTISIRRPVLASVMSIVIVIFGILSYFELGIREYPVVDPPVITISTSYTGANADIIEREITEPIEAQVNAVSGIRTLSSVSQEGRSVIQVEFSIDTDLEVAANDVRDRVSRAVENLPPDANPPSVRKEDSDSDPIIFVNLSSDRRDRMELTQIARDIFREQLRTIDGVSIVSVWGQQRYTIRLWMDPDLLDAYDLTPQDVHGALRSENIELPSGIIRGDDMEMTIRTMGRMSGVDEFNHLILREERGNIIRFQDVGHAELTTRDSRTVLKRNGEPMVGLAVIPQPGSNQIESADEVYRRIDRIMEDLPSDIKIQAGFDKTDFIRESISDVQSSILTAFLLVVAIIFLFLRDVRSTFIPIVVVPIALLGAFFIMYSFGFTINILTLLALILAIGLVVDDAIIVLENIYSKMEEGLDPINAGIEGTREIFFAIIATTLALVSVFTPILFLEGVTGRLFREFGMVIAGAVVISSFVALTLTPMLSTRMLGSGNSGNSTFYKKTEPWFRRVNEIYSRALDKFLEQRENAFWILGGSVAVILGMFVMLPEEVAPLEDRSTLNISARAPEGATFDYMDQVMDQVSDLVAHEVPESLVLNTITSRGAANSAEGFLTLAHASDRSRSQMKSADALGTALSRLPGAQVNVSQQQTLSGTSSGLPVEFVIQAPSLENLREVIPGFLDEARRNPAFSFVDVDLKFNRPELRVDIDRSRSRSLGVSVSDIAETLQLAYSGSRYGYFDMDGRQYWVQVQLMNEKRSTPRDLRALHVRGAGGDLIGLDNLVELQEASSPPELYRFNRLSSATFSASLAEGYSIADGIAAMRNIASDRLGEEFSTDLKGTSREFEESVSNLYFIFILAVIFIYLVLAAQFESFRDPLIILLTVPLALVGSLLALWYFGESLNIFSKIAMIMLIGLVTKNGILIVEFANQKQQQGLSLSEAIRGAAISRFRPIMMTTLSTVLGILPLALAMGAGAESRVSMGIAVIGGMIIGTLLSLFVVPAIYTYLATDKNPAQPTAEP